MSLQGAMLTMRATTRRNTGAADRYGHPPKAGPWEPIAGPLHCYVWVASARELIDGVKLGVVEVVRGLFRADADIKHGDQITELVNRRGRAVMEGTLEVDAVTDRPLGAAPGLKYVQLRRCLA